VKSVGINSSSETLVDFQRTTRRYIPKDRTLHNPRCKNLRFYHVNNSLNGAASEMYGARPLYMLSLIRLIVATLPWKLNRLLIVEYPKNEIRVTSVIEADNGPNRVGVSPTPTPEEGNRSSFRNAVL
jgi:hypothetical protein